MLRVRVMSLNGENMGDLVPRDLTNYGPDGRHSDRYWRARLLAAIVDEVKPDIVGLVEAPSSQERTEKFVEDYLGGQFSVHQGERRGVLGMAFLIRKGLPVQVSKRTKDQSLKDFDLSRFDADGDGIKEIYSWANRVPLEIELSGGDLEAPTVFILIHAKSKGVFVPGDLFAYDRLCRANRMKLRAQSAAVRKRLDALVDEEGKGHVVVMGDMNDGPEFDAHAAMLGGAFLEPVMGNIWAPKRIFHNTHESIPSKERWTIDFKDRVVNPLEASRYGQPTDMRAWIDHILVSPELSQAVETETAEIAHRQPHVPGLPRRLRGKRGTDHHPPHVVLDL